MSGLEIFISVNAAVVGIGCYLIAHTLREAIGLVMIYVPIATMLVIIAVYIMSWST